MSTYNYKARDGQGILVTGAMEAGDESELTKSLEGLGYSIIEAVLQDSRGSAGISLAERFNPVNRQDAILFTRQLAVLLRGGTPLVPSLASICEQTTKRRFKLILEDVRQSVQKGTSFSESLAKHPAIFSGLFVNMVKVGEAGGLLEVVLDRLAELGTKEMETQSRITSALVYPIVLVVVAFAVVGFLIVGVLPKFVVVFTSSGAALPLPTKIILGISVVMKRMWLPILVVMAVLFLWFKNSLKNEGRRERFHAWLLKIPLFGSLYAKVQISRFTRITSTLISSGIPILHALEVVENTITNLVIRRAIRGVKQAIAGGRPLTEPFKASGLFSPMVVQMISTGEKSGNLDKMLNEISDFYDPEIEYTIKNLTSLLEPIMLLVTGAIVAFIALSVLLPIFNLIKVFRG
ncbi:MAG: type II secretion system F family protein [Candidatus Omnitrophota bacterium]